MLGSKITILGPVRESFIKKLIVGYTEGVLWGIGPTILFFMAAFICLRRGMELPAALAVGGVLWLGGALLHQWVLR